MDQNRDPNLGCPICGAANCACGGPAKLKYPPVGWEGEWPGADNQQDDQQENNNDA